MREIPAATRVLIESEEGAYEAIVLMELRHPQIGGTLRLANSFVDITSKGNVYTGFPFTIKFPDIPGSANKGQAAVNNVDRRIGLFLQSLRSPPMVTLILVVDSDLDTWLMRVQKLWLRNIRGDELTVQGDLDTWDFSQEPWPSRRVVESRYPGVFR